LGFAINTGGGTRSTVLRWRPEIMPGIEEFLRRIDSGFMSESLMNAGNGLVVKTVMVMEFSPSS